MESRSWPHGHRRVAAGPRRGRGTGRCPFGCPPAGPRRKKPWGAYPTRGPAVPGTPRTSRRVVLGFLVGEETDRPPPHIHPSQLLSPPALRLDSPEGEGSATALESSPILPGQVPTLFLLPLGLFPSGRRETEAGLGADLWASLTLPLEGHSGRGPDWGGGWRQGHAGRASRPRYCSTGGQPGPEDGDSSPVLRVSHSWASTGPTPPQGL